MLLINRAPAFLYALFFTLTLFIAFEMYVACVLALPLFFLLPKREKFIVLLSSLTLFATVKVIYHLPEKTPLKGAGAFRITEMKKAKRGWVYKGVMQEFTADTLTYYHLPCSLYSQSLLNPSYSYAVQGELNEFFGKSYTLKSKEKQEPLKKTFSLCALRYKAKQRVKEYITTHVQEKKAKALLAGLATGNLDDNVLAKEFEKRGLSHLLAISGFHFALLGTCIYFFLRPFNKPKNSALILIFLLTLYFLFIGNAPSVQRAWMISLLFLLGLLFERLSSGLNSLGIALLLSAIFNPLSFFSAGFQLSYMATFALLVLFRPLERVFRHLLPGEFIPLKWSREAFALVLSVYIAIFPLLLFLFSKCPLHGIFYNLFFPFLVSLSALGLIVSTLFHFIIPPFGLYLHALNGWYTESILNLLELPLIPHKTLYVKNLPGVALLIYWALLFGFVLWWEQRREEKLEIERDEFRFF